MTSSRTSSRLLPFHPIDLRQGFMMFDIRPYVGEFQAISVRCRP
jgi:hypothetical protein